MKHSFADVHEKCLRSVIGCNSRLAAKGDHDLLTTKRYRAGVHRCYTRGLVIRRTKERPLTFDGTHLFPVRCAETVAYQLSDAAQDLYGCVTDHVRTQMGRAKHIEEVRGRIRGGTTFPLSDATRSSNGYWNSSWTTGGVPS